jgi:putative membrane protein insertion efficiency factor
VREVVIQHRNPRRRLVRVALAAAVLTGAWDLSRSPDRQLATRVLVAGIKLHRLTTAVWLEKLGVECRFEPSCSSYAEQAILTRGAVAGGWRTAGRLLRCGPWTPQGSVDPPPSRD